MLQISKQSAHEDGNVVSHMQRSPSHPTWVLFTFSTCCILRCLVCIVVVVLCVLLSSNVYLLYYMCIVVFTLDGGLLARSQYSEGPATGHLDTSFSCFPCVYKQKLIWFPRFQVATTCFSCSPPDLNLLVAISCFVYM